MKKVIAILAVLIMATSLFAASGDAIKVSSDAKEKTPVFAIYGSLAAISDYTADTVEKGTATAPVLASEDDITATSIPAYFVIRQDNASPTWAKENKTYTITIAATEMVHGTITDSKTAAPTFSAATANSAVYGTGKGITSAAWSGQVLTLAYNGNTKVDNCQLGSFTLTWTKNEELAVGLHTATITMTVATV